MTHYISIDLKVISLSILLAVLISGVSRAQEINDDTRMDHAKILYQKGLYSAAREEFAAMSGSAYGEEAQYLEAISAVRAGHGDGEFLIKKFIEEYPSNPLAQNAYGELGNYYFEKRDFAQAVNYFSQSKSQSDEQSFKLGYSYFQIGEYDKALKELGKLKGKNNSWEKDAAYFIGFIHYENEDFSKSQKALGEAFESENYGDQAKELNVAVLYQTEKYKELITFVNAEIETKSGPTLNYLSNSYYALGRYEEASESFGQLLAKHSKFRNSRNYYKAGYSSFKINNFKDSEDKLKRAAVKEDTVGAYASYYLGIIYFEQDNMPFAVTSFGNTTKYDSRLQEDAYYNQSRALLKQPNFQQAIEVLSESKEKFPKGKYITEVNEMLSMAYLHTNNYELAMEYIEDLPSLTQTVKNVYQRVSFIHGKSLFNSKKFSEAAKAFEKSLVYNTDPDLTQQSFYWMGEALSLLKREKDATFYYKSVKSQDKELYLKAQYGLGYAYFNIQNYQDASVAFTNFDKGYDKSVSEKYLSDAILRLADCHFALKSYEQSITYYNKALKAGNKKLGQIYFQIGLLNRYLENDDEAKKYFSKLVKEVPNSTKIDHAQFQIAEIDFKKGETEDAIEAYRIFMIQYPNSPLIPHALLNQAVAYENLQNNKSSITNYKEILNRFPRHETAKSALLALQTKNANGGFDEFDQFLAIYKSANPNSEALENIEYENARVAFFNQNYESAISGFEYFNKTYPNSLLRTESKFFIGDSYYRLNQYEKALPVFYSIADDTDYSKHVRVLYRIAEMEAVLDNIETSNKYYYKLAAVIPSARYRVFVEKGLMENYLLMSEYDSVIHYGNLLLDNARIGVLVEAAANLSLGQAYKEKEEYDNALLHLLPLVAGSPDEKGAEANYLVGQIYFDQGKNEEALESLFSLTNNFKEYGIWTARGFLMMAEIYIATDEEFQAKATLSSLVENAEDEEIVALASARLELLESKEQKEEGQ